ncbi:MAG TPA: transcriptional repressor, partial [Methanomassiliicoccaceae archaeon]|nr:transcriptional repressor [Methanomassiliicoccaceae archaeon]
MVERKRWSKQSRTILDIIYNNEEGLTASEIYDIARETHPNISLGTVYRNLRDLQDVGLIRE